VQPDFKLGPGDLEAAARLCNLVEGVPLAIILAASWVELLSLEEIYQEISQNLDFLESRDVDIPERQRSLRAVFNASWDALDSQEQGALERLAVFQGSFTREAALAVTRVSLQTLLDLLHKSWLERSQNGRYQIHELQRQYASEKLQQKPADWEIARNEHAAYFTARLEKINLDMRGPAQADAFREISAEFVNIQIAWNSLLEEGQYEILVHKFLPPIYRYCEARIKSDQVLRLVNNALHVLEADNSLHEKSTYQNILLVVQASFYSKGDSIRLDRYDIMIPPAHEANIHQVGSHLNTLDDLRSLGLWASLFAYLFGRFADNQVGADYLRKLIQEYRQLKQHWELAVTLELLGGLNLAVSMNATQKENTLEEAGEVLTEALAIFKRLDDIREYSYTLVLLGGYHAYQGNWDEATTTWQQADEQFDQIGDTITSLHWLLGDLLFKIGDYDTAFQYYQQIREKYLQRGQKRIAAYALSIESMQALRYRGIQHARETREESLRLSQQVQDEFGEAWSTWEMGEIERVAGNYQSALQGFESARLMFNDVDESNGLIFYHRGLGDVAFARENYSQAFTQFEQSNKHSETLGFHWGAVYALAGMGRAESALQNFDAARKHLTRSLQSVSTIDDAGLALLVLNSCAYLYSARGENQPATEISNLVAGHFATWNEIKRQASDFINNLGSSPTSQAGAGDEEHNQEIIWQLIHRLLETDFRPS
jgi:tetratricopeptide (TPR) repeat protein